MLGYYLRKVPMTGR